MFEIGFLCPKPGNQRKRQDLGGKQPVLKLRKWTPSKFFFKMELLPYIFFIYFFSILNGLLILTMLSTENCL